MGFWAAEPSGHQQIGQKKNKEGVEFLKVLDQLQHFLTGWTLG